MTNSSILRRVDLHADFCDGGQWICSALAFGLPSVEEFRLSFKNGFSAVAGQTAGHCGVVNALSTSHLPSLTILGICTDRFFPDSCRAAMATFIERHAKQLIRADFRGEPMHFVIEMLTKCRMRHSIMSREERRVLLNAHFLPSCNLRVGCYTLWNKLAKSSSRSGSAEEDVERLWVEWFPNDQLSFYQHWSAEVSFRAGQLLGVARQCRKSFLRKSCLRLTEILVRTSKEHGFLDAGLSEYEPEDMIDGEAQTEFGKFQALVLLAVHLAQEEDASSSDFEILALILDLCSVPMSRFLAHRDHAQRLFEGMMKYVPNFTAKNFSLSSLEVFCKTPKLLAALLKEVGRVLPEWGAAEWGALVTAQLTQRDARKDEENFPVIMDFIGKFRRGADYRQPTIKINQALFSRLLFSKEQVKVSLAKLGLHPRMLLSQEGGWEVPLRNTPQTIRGLVEYVDIFYRENPGEGKETEQAELLVEINMNLWKELFRAKEDFRWFKMRAEDIAKYFPTRPESVNRFLNDKESTEYECNIPNALAFLRGEPLDENREPNSSLHISRSSPPTRKKCILM